MSKLTNILERFKSPILENYEKIWLVGPTKRLAAMAKIDTGANRTSIDRKLAEELQLLEPKNIAGFREFTSGLGREERPMVHCTLIIGGIARTTQVSISNRSHMKHPVIVGRQDIQGFLVKPAQSE